MELSNQGRSFFLVTSDAEQLLSYCRNAVSVIGIYF